MGDTREGEAEASTTNLQVRIELQVSRDDPPSVGEILNAAHNVLEGALNALGIPGARAVLATWHEDRAREAEEF